MPRATNFMAQPTNYLDPVTKLSIIKNIISIKCNGTRVDMGLGYGVRNMTALIQYNGLIDRNYCQLLYNFFFQRSYKK